MFAYNAPKLGECTVVGPFNPLPDFDWSDRKGLWLFRTKDDDEVVRSFLSLQEKEIGQKDEIGLHQDSYLCRRPFEGDWEDSDFDQYDPNVPLSYIAALIQNQWEGPEGSTGPLFAITGYGNRFSCGDGEFVVNVYWSNHKDKEGWVVYPWRQGIYRWRNPGEAFTNK